MAKDKTQLARMNALDILRTAVRLKHRIEIRNELNELEDAMLTEHDQQIMAGEAFMPNLSRVFTKGLGDGK